MDCRAGEDEGLHGRPLRLLTHRPAHSVKRSVKAFARKHAHEGRRERTGVAGALIHWSTKHCRRYIDEIAFCFEQRERSCPHPRLPGRLVRRRSRETIDRRLLDEGASDERAP